MQHLSRKALGCISLKHGNTKNFAIKLYDLGIVTFLVAQTLVLKRETNKRRNHGSLNTCLNEIR